MHGFEGAPTSSTPSPTGVPWYRLLTQYHWFVLMIAALGWLFDCLDQQLFVLARPSAMEELIPADSAVYKTPEALNKARGNAGHISTSVFIAGWACGGLFFGMLGDRIGRAKTMLITILLYSLFTGLSSLSVTPWDFALYRFLTGLGVGGEFAVGVSLVAEVMPAAARPYTLGLLQALSAVGNISAALIFLSLGIAEEEGLQHSPWRIMFVIGALPALLALLIRSRLKEPETWQRAAHDGVVQKQLGSYSELFGDRTLRRHAILGLLLGCAGVVGLWAVGFYTPDLIGFAQRPAVTNAVVEEFKQKHDPAVIDRIRAATSSEAIAALSEDEQKLKTELDKTIGGRLKRWPAYTSMMQNIGAFFGMFGFGALAQRIGRKPAFALAFIAAFASTFIVYWQLSEFWQIFVFVPIMGFCQLSLFAGYAIYFPELFPTRLRSTGTSFCYNVGRFIAATGPMARIFLDAQFSAAKIEPIVAMRYTGMTMSCVFLIGLLVLPFLPETKGKPLPE